MGVLGQGTAVVDGQRTTLPPSAAFLPPAYGVQTSGVPNVTPIIPPMYGGSASIGTGTTASSVNGMGTADNNGAATQIAANNPHNWKVSPVWWAIGALVGGVLALQFVSFRETVDEHGHAGPLHEDAHESAGS